MCASGIPPPLAADAAAKGQPLRCVGHDNVPRRFDRYDLTNGYNVDINARQFGQFGAI